MDRLGNTHRYSRLVLATGSKPHIPNIEGIDKDGIYTFHLASDDGSVLRIGGEVVVDHDGLHGMSERSGQVALARGRHSVDVSFFQSGGGVGVSLEVTDPSGDRFPLPTSWLWEPGE